MTTPNTPSSFVDLITEKGYGYDGTFTQRAWQAECLKYFEAGAEAFLAWQKSWQQLAKQKILEENCDATGTVEGVGQAQIQFREMAKSRLDFSRHTFACWKGARGYKFLYDANFTYAIFEDYADFKGSIFRGKADFTHAEFGSVADFRGCQFQKIALFQSVIIREDAYFQNAKFKGDAYFGKHHFTSDDRSNETTFRGVVRFWEATFSGVADFGAVDFEKWVSFFRTKFHSEINFRYANFKAASSFENAEFKNVVHFENAKFNFPSSTIPSFRTVNIGSTRLDFSPYLSGDAEDAVFKINYFDEESIKEAIINIQFLKHLSEQHGQIDQALNFNAMELRAKYWQVVEPLRAQNLPLLERLFKRYFNGEWWAMRPTWLYGLLSDFGRSYMRPLLAYIAVFVFTFIFMLGFEIYFATEHNPTNCPYLHEVVSLECKVELEGILPLDGYDAAWGYAMYHATGLVDFTGDSKMKEAITLRLYGKPVKSKCAQLFGALLSIINTALLFLIALGLRNSYRLK